MWYLSLMKTALELSLEMHQDLNHALTCVDGCDKEDIRTSFLIEKIASLQERLDRIEWDLKYKASRE